MKQEVSLDHDHGKTSNAWYERDPDRFEHEKRQLERLGFKFEFVDGVTTWTGSIYTADLHNYKPRFYESIEVTIQCYDSFPESFPRVIDTKGVLHQQPHVEPSNALCYAFPPQSDLNFAGKSDLVDLIGVLEVFLLKQDLFKCYGEWFDGARHGVAAFIEHEFLHGRFNPDEICPCRSTSTTYAECHLNGVRATIREINRKLRWEFGRRRLGRNQKCPCQKGISEGVKYKKCCLHTGKFAQGHDVITLYKELTPEKLKVELDLLDAEFEKSNGWQ